MKSNCNGSVLFQKCFVRGASATQMLQENLLGFICTTKFHYISCFCGNLTEQTLCAVHADKTTHRDFQVTIVEAGKWRTPMDDLPAFGAAQFKSKIFLSIVQLYPSFCCVFQYNWIPSVSCFFSNRPFTFICTKHPLSFVYPWKLTSYLHQKQQQKNAYDMS